MFQNYEYYNQAFNIQPFITKLKNNELTLENILEEDEIINDIKFNKESEFIDFLTEDKIKALIDYSTKMPLSDNHNIGYKYPFNATEILCSENENFQNKFLISKPFSSKENQIKNFKEKINKAKKIKKGGFIFQMFEIINKVNNNNLEINEELEIENIPEEEMIKYESKENKGQKVIYENVDYLLNFLKESEDVKKNYVLVGYFYKILNSLININKNKIIQYLYDFPKKDEFDILNIFVQNMNRKSICDIVRKLLTFEDDFSDKFEDKKIFLFEKILDELNIGEDKDKYECICDSLYLVMDNAKFFDLFMTKKNLLQKIYDIIFNCAKNKNIKKLISLLQLAIKINENILQHFEKNLTDKENNNNNNNNNDINEYLYGSSFPNEKSISSKNDNSENLKNYLNIFFSILEEKKFDFIGGGEVSQEKEDSKNLANMKKQKKIGLLKIKQTEYISTLIDIFVNSYGHKYYENKIDDLIDIINNSGIFWNLHDTFFLFPNSNLYQILYKRIIEIVINENSPKNLIKAFFFENSGQKRNLINFYIEKEISNEIKLEHPLTKVYTMNPCFTFLNSILYQIYISQNEEIRKILEENNDIHIFVEVMVEEFEKIFNYKLLYQDPLDILCSNNSNKEEPSPFGNKNIFEIFEENCLIYNKYKKGEEYKILLEEKKKRNEKENENEIKEEIKNEKEENNKGVQYIEDLDEEFDDTNDLYKIEKINLKKDKENFLAMLGKSTEEINNEKINEDDSDNNDVYKGRFNINDLEEDEDEKDKEKKDEKINEDLIPDLNENKIHHVEYNKNEIDTDEKNE